MRVTIVIVNWNGGDLILECLASLAALKPPFGVRVIVVDNASRDGSPERIAANFPQVTLIQAGGNLGFGRGNNLARDQADTPYVLILNPDTRVPAGTLEAMVAFLDGHAKVGALGCRMVGPDGDVHDLGLQWFPTPWREFVRLAFVSSATRRVLARFLPTTDPRQSGPAAKLYGGCLFARREVLDAVGWFDERFFMYAEDVDLCRQIAERGWTLHYLSDVAVTHVSGGTSRKAPSDFAVLMKTESIGKLIGKYQGRGGFGRYRLAVVTAALIRLVPLWVLVLPALAMGGRRRAAMAASRGRWQAILAWGLGLRRAAIPDGSTATGAAQELESQP